MMNTVAERTKPVTDNHGGFSQTTGELYYEGTNVDAKMISDTVRKTST